MARTDELSLLLRIEYGFWNQYHRWYQTGRISQPEAVHRLNAQRKSIISFKKKCELELQEVQEEEYPEEYYFATPEPAEILFRKSAAPEPTTLSTPAQIPVPDTGTEAVQLSIFDVFENIGT